MKKVFLSEGRNDTDFLSIFLDENCRSLSYDRFDIDNAEGNSIIPKESEKTRRFREPRNQDDVLIKSEGGDENLVTVLGSELPNLVGNDLDLCVLIDLDGKDVSERITQFEEKLQPHTPGNKISVCHKDTLVSTTFIQAHVAKVLIDGKYIGQFDLLTFTEDLEEVADITGTENRDTIKEKIGDILERNQVSKPVKIAVQDRRSL